MEAVLNKTDPYTTGRPRKVNLRERLNAIFYLNKTGGPWRYLPNDFPSFTGVSDSDQTWIRHKVWEQITTEIRQKIRKEGGRNETPRAGIMESQTVKGTSESAPESGVDGGKLIKGRKRPIIVDTMGYILVTGVHAATIYEGRAARLVVPALFLLLNTVKKIGADGADSGSE